MDLIFATNNAHKLREIQDILGKKYRVKSLSDIACFEELPETADTLEGNASQKAFYVYGKYKENCFSDDTGLLVEALQGKPGVLSARYAGEQKNADDNINKILHEMNGIEKNRKAMFKTIISLIINGEEKLFEGIVDGVILEERRGEKGFGYDPIFQPDGYNCSFAEMTAEQKNKISHRAMAVDKLVNYLNNCNNLVYF